MKKIVSLILILIFFSLPVFSASIELPEYEPYGPTEFPEWSMKLRRGESLFFGSLVITMPVAMLSYNLAASNGLITPSQNDVTNFLYQASFAAALSLGIAVGDYIIGELE